MQTKCSAFVLVCEGAEFDAMLSRADLRALRSRSLAILAYKSSLSLKLNLITHDLGGVDLYGDRKLRVARLQTRCVKVTPKKGDSLSYDFIDGSG